MSLLVYMKYFKIKIWQDPTPREKTISAFPGHPCVRTGCRAAGQPPAGTGERYAVIRLTLVCHSRSEHPLSLRVPSTGLAVKDTARVMWVLLMICSSHGPNSTGVVLPLRDLRGQIVHLVAAPACKHSNSGQHVGADLAACRREHPNAAAPNLFGTRDRFCGRQCFHPPRVKGMVSE